MPITAKPISQLDALTSPTDSDLLVTVSDGSNYKITKAKFLNSENNTLNVAYNSIAFGFDNFVTYSDYCTAVGKSNFCSYSSYSSAIGYNNTSYDQSSVAIGYYNTVNDHYSTAVGVGNYSGNAYATASGYTNTASGYCSTAVGGENSAVAYCATAIGWNNHADSSSIAAGCQNYTDAYSAVVVGNNNVTYSDYSVCIGYNNVTYSGYYDGGSHHVVIGSSNFVTGGEWGGEHRNILIGHYNTSQENDSIGIGTSNNLSSNSSVGIGYDNTASGFGSAALGHENTSSGNYSISLGAYNNSTAYCSIALGTGNYALYDRTSGEYSTACGYNNSASGYCVSSFGCGNSASGFYSTAVGFDCSAGGEKTNAIGYSCSAVADKSTAVGYKATVHTENAVNIGGPIIVARAEGFGETDWEHYAGAEIVLMSEEIDLTHEADLHLNSFYQGHAYKDIPSNSHFYPDEVGLILTDVNLVSEDASIQFGTEAGAAISVSRVQGVSASGSGTGIVLNYSASVAGNTLIAVCAAHDVSDITATLSGSVSMSRQYLQTNSNMSIALFVANNVSSHTDVTFSFSDSTDAVGFIYEYSGLKNTAPDDVTANNGADNVFATTSYITPDVSGIYPGSLMLGIAANAQTGAFSNPTNGFTILDQGNFGSYRCVVTEKTFVGATSTNVVIESTLADFVTILAAYHANLVSSDDLLASQVTAGSALYKRYKYTELDNNDGHTFLWAGVSGAGSVDSETGVLRGRFYWKGILVEDN